MADSINSDELSIAEIVIKCRQWFTYLLSYWKTIVLASLFGAAAGFFYAKSVVPQYFAECTFVLDEGNQTAGSQYAGLASSFGIDIGGGGANGLFEGNNIVALYKSRLMIEKALLSVAIINGKEELLIDRYLKINKIKAYYKTKNGLQHMKFSEPREKFSREQDSVIGNIVKDINKDYLVIDRADKTSNITSVKVTANDEGFAAAFANRLVDNVNFFYIQTKTKRSAQNLKMLTKQLDSVRLVLNSNMNRTASAMDENPNANPALQILRVSSQRKQIDVQNATGLYSEIVKNIEVTKASLQRETPLIQVVDRPIMPLDKKEASKINWAIIGGFLGGLLLILILILRHGIKSLIT